MKLIPLSEYVPGERDKPIKHKMVDTIPVKLKKGSFVIGLAKRYSLLIDKGVRKEDAIELRKEIAEAVIQDNAKVKLLERIKYF